MTPTRWEERWVGRSLCLVLAVLLWLAVEGERTAELTLSVPVTLMHLPAGLTVVSAPPSLTVTVSGPRIVLLSLKHSGVSCPLELDGLGPGSADFNAESSLKLDHDLKVTRLYPSPVRVSLAQKVGVAP